jgi:hypothetical protein
MRKITEKVATAFANDKNISLQNTKVEVSEKTTFLSLHNNIIARKHSNGVVEFNNQGYTTQTTKERLNGIAVVMGLSKLYQKQGVWYYNDENDNKIQFNNNEWVKMN